jgi:hypothetical protein
VDRRRRAIERVVQLQLQIRSQFMVLPSVNLSLPWTSSLSGEVILPALSTNLLIRIRSVS